MKDLKKLQESVHNHSVTITESLQRLKMRLQAEATEKDLTDIERLKIESDIRTVKTIEELVINFHSMDGYYNASSNIFGRKFI